MVQEVFELTGYDRVMGYKFHGLGPDLGLHYPATDKRLQCKICQDEKLPFDLTLCGSTLRAPHCCHAQYTGYMNSIGSLVMAVVVNDEDEDTGGSAPPPHPPPTQSQKRKRRRGSVVCHHSSPMFAPFPLHYACELFSSRFYYPVKCKLELENQLLEKQILITQTLLCDMLIRDVPSGIATQRPSIMDLVKCDGAVFLYNNKLWKLGVTPTDYQIRDIAVWLSLPLQG